MEHSVNKILDSLETASQDKVVQRAVVSQLVQEILRATRTQFDMEVAFISRFIHNRRVFQFVDAKEGVNIISVGDSNPLEESFCHRIVNNLTPQLIRDAQLDPSVADLAATVAVPVGAHISVPIFLEDGSCFGTFCVFSRVANSALNDADLSALRLITGIVTKLLKDISTSQIYADKLEREIAYIISQKKAYAVAQPIVDITQNNRYRGFETLCRVKDMDWSPDKLFADAEEVGLSFELNALMIREAAELLKQTSPDQYLAVNITPDFLASEVFLSTLQKIDLTRLVFEITEHAAIAEYDDILENLRTVRKLGARIAIDDVGAGHSSLRHILKIHPDIIKLDRSLIENIDRDEEKQSLLEALLTFARRMGYSVVAEGVETPEELATLKAHGVTLIQGYLFARPAPLHELLQQA